MNRDVVLTLLVVVALGTMAALAWSFGTGGDSSRRAYACYREALGPSVAIKSGHYLMGSAQHYPAEGPVLEVDVDAFEIDRHEVTNAQFRSFVEATGYVTSAERAVDLGFKVNGSAVFADGAWAFVPGANWRHPDGSGSSIEGQDREPVVQVSFEDARAYAAWADRRLPTEAQWEYAARGGLAHAEFAWGDEYTPGGEYLANTWQGPFPVVNKVADGYAGRAPVGCFPPNGYGLYDMIGNVWEWTADPYYPSHHHAAAEGDRGVDSRQPGVPVGVIKGGSFLCSPNFCRRYRPAARFPQDTQLGTNHLGFRTVAR